MDRRTFVKGSAALVGAATLPTVHAQAQAAPTKLRFGHAITLSGPLAPGADSTTVSNYKLLNKVVNDAGGIMLKKFNKRCRSRWSPTTTRASRTNYSSWSSA